MDDITLWVDKYAPKKLDDMVLSDSSRKNLENIVKSGLMPSMTLIGKQGMGKTTLARVLCNEFGATTLYVPCATDGVIDNLRTKIKHFCECCSIDGKPKCLILDEIDSASSSGDNNFQKGLRTFIEEFQKDTRFILTANYDKIIPAITSRCNVFKFDYSKNDLLNRLIFIMKQEGVSFTKDSLIEFAKSSFHMFPDTRRIINTLQTCCSSGELIPTKSCSESNDFVKELVSKCRNEKNILNLRQYYITNKGKIEDFITFSSELFNYVVDNGIVSNGDCIIHMSNIIYQMNLVIDKEIQFFSLITYLNKCISND